jgi:dihydrofolate reductase
VTPQSTPVAAPTFALVAAVASNGVIGAGNALPWRLPADLRHFRALTTGHTVVMGRKTWESLPHALPARQNIVVTRQSAYRAEGARVVATLEAALAAATFPPPVFCIGGGEIYREALPLADAVYVTDVEHAFDGDTTFPPLDPDEWHATTRERHLPDTADGLAYTFVTYRRVAPPRRA